MRILSYGFLLFALVASTAAVDAQNAFTLGPDLVISEPIPVADRGGVSITQNDSLIVETNGVTCANNQTGIPVENGYWRVFPLAEFDELDDNFFSIESVDIGVTVFAIPPGGFTTELRVYRVDGGLDLSADTFPLSAATLLSTDTLVIGETDGAGVYNIPIVDSPDLATTDTLAIEWYTPDATASGAHVRAGVNDEGEDAVHYLWAPACGANDPTAVTALGAFEDLHWVVQVNGVTIPVDSEPGAEKVSAAALSPAAPNPVVSTASIAFTLEQTTDVRLAVYDVLGREVAVLAEGTYATGTHTATFEASSLPSGTYLYRLVAGGDVQARTMTLVR